EYGRMLDKVARSLLTGLAKRLAAKGLSVKTHMSSGAAYREIVEEASKEKADLIVMGTHGHRGIGHLLLGSVAAKVVRMAGCPVLTVRSDDTSDDKSDKKTAGPKRRKK